MIEVLRSPALEGVPHGFFGRRGGVSKGAWSGLNAGPGSDDDPAAVAKNRALAVEAVLPGAALATVYQVHSPDAVEITELVQNGERPRADAMVTTRPDVLLGIVTADCAPVLLADRAAGVIGAAHAGWRGAIGGVIENTVAKMVAAGARRENIAAAIGPAIAADSYEVDEAFRDRFTGENAANARFFRAGRPGHHRFDLPGHVAEKCRAAGIEAVDIIAQDTAGQPERFFSYRRSSLAGEDAYGRQISLIGLSSSG